MNKSIFCIAILFILTGLTNAQTRLKEDITCKQAWQLIQKHRHDTNFVVLDVRTPDEFEDGIIERAILIDYKSENFHEKVSKLDKSKTYLVYCRGGVRSLGAIEIMKDQDFKYLFHLFEGYKAWKKEGYKTVTE